LAEDPGLLVLDVEGSKADVERTKRQYGLTSLQRLESQD
jgi:hypothetical protein